MLSESTWFRGSLVLVLIAFTATFVRAMVKGESIESTLAEQQRQQEDRDKVQQEWQRGLTSAVNDVAKEIVGLRGDLANTSEKVGNLQADGTQTQRDAASRDLIITRLQGDMDTIKRQMASLESGIKATEGRLISVEIAASRGGTVPGAQGGDGK